MIRCCRRTAHWVIGAGLLLAAQPAFADGGVITAYVTRKTVAFVVNFLSSAASNANAAAAATAVSKSGTAFDPDSDTGFFSATASVDASSGDLARSAVTVEADYNFFEPNVLTITPGPSTVAPPTGISWEWYANASIKGIWQILLEAIPSPLSLAAGPAPAAVGEIVVPLALQFNLDGQSSYRFSAALELDDATTIDLVSGSAGPDGAAIVFPYLESSNPGLSAALRSQYLGAVAGKRGAVSVNLGEGLLPPGPDGASGLVVAVPLGQQFRLNSDLDGNSGAAIPEPASWALLIVGFALAGMRLRWRRAVQAAASPSSGIA